MGNSLSAEQSFKIDSRQNVVNEYRQPFPKDLEPLLVEWLTVWRSRRLAISGSAAHLVFMNRDGNPLTSPMLRETFTRTIFRFTGRSTTPHMVRDSWASEYLDATGDIAGAADKLGDLPSTVMSHYAHVLKRKAQNRTGAWLNNHLS